MTTRHTTLRIYSVSRFYVAPEDQGQMVEVSYGYAADDTVIVVKTYDRSDRSTTYRAYEDADPGADFDPWNRRPTLGAEIGECQVTSDE